MWSFVSLVNALRKKAPPTVRPRVADADVRASVGLSRLSTVEISTRGLQETIGIIQEEYQDDLASLSDRLTLFDQMRKSDSSCATVEKAVSMPIRSAEWTVRTKDPAQAEMVARLNRNFFGGMTHTWDCWLSEALTSLVYGFAVFEKVWEEEPGGVRLRKLPGRNPRTTYRWMFDDTYGLAGWIQQGYWLEKGNMVFKQVEVPIEKLLVVSYGSEWGNPEGCSIFRSAYKHWSIKKALETLACIRCDRAAGGLPIGVFDKDADPSNEEVEALQEVVSRIRTHQAAGIALHPRMDIKDLELSADVPFQELIEYEAQEILRASLAPFFGMGQGANTGTYNLADRLMGFFLEAENSIADGIAAQFALYVIRPWVHYNYGPQETYPYLHHTDLRQKTSLTEFAKLLTILFDPDLDLDRRLPEIADFARAELRLPPRQTVDSSTPGPASLRPLSIVRDAVAPNGAAKDEPKTGAEKNPAPKTIAAARSGGNGWSAKTHGILERMSREYKLTVAPMVATGDLAAAVGVKVPLIGALEASFRLDLAESGKAQQAPVLAEAFATDLRCSMLEVDKSSIPCLNGDA